MPTLLLLRNFLWVAPAVLQVIVLVVLVRRDLHRQFPFFSLYALQGSVFTAVLFPMYLFHVPGKIWAPTFFVGNALNTAIRFGIVYEIYSHVFNNYAAVRSMGKGIFRGGLLLLLAVAVMVASKSKDNNAYFAMYVFHVIEQTASVLQAGLLLILFAFSAYVGLSWRNYSFGIALGLGIYAIVKLATAALQASVVASGNLYTNLVVMGTFQIAVLIWFFYLLVPEVSGNQSLSSLPDHDLELWNKELQRLTHQ
jgi:hypothetical protein